MARRRAGAERTAAAVRERPPETAAPAAITPAAGRAERPPEAAAPAEITPAADRAERPPGRVAGRLGRAAGRLGQAAVRPARVEASLATTVAAKGDTAQERMAARPAPSSRPTTATLLRPHENARPARRTNASNSSICRSHARDARAT